MTWRFDWITSWDEIWSGPFLAQWHEWMETSPTAHVFFHPALVRAWVETYLPLRRMEPRFLIAARGDSTVFLPMVLWRRNWKNAFQRLLIPVGYSDYDYHDPIVAGQIDGNILQEFWAELPLAFRKGPHGEYDALELTGIREQVACSRAFVKEGDICPWCDLTSLKDGEAFLSSVNRNLRKSLNRKQRRLAEMGESSYHVFSAGDLPEALSTLEEFLIVHAHKWPHAYKPPNLHRNMLILGVPAGIVHFSLLRVDREVIAWQLGFVDSRRFYAYIQAHRDEYAAVSPGQILLYHCVQDAIHRELRIFDHLRGEESYKSGWTNCADDLYRLQVARSSVGATLRNLAVDRLKPALCQAAQAWRGR